MSSNFSGGIIAGSTSVSIPIVLRKTSDSTEQTGKVAADMTAYYWRQGSANVSISLSDLGAVNSAYASGGVKEVDSTNQPGLYRLDLPNAALATGVDWVVVSVKVASVFVYYERFALQAAVTVDGTSALTEAYPAKGGALTLASALYAILQNLEEVSVSGTTLTVKQRGGTVAETFTLNDASQPTSRTRAT